MVLAVLIGGHIHLLQSHSIVEALLVDDIAQGVVLTSEVQT